MTDYTPRLKASYVGTVRAAMKEEFGYKNDMMIPRLDKIVLNMGVGDAVKDTKKVKHAQDALTLLLVSSRSLPKPSNLSLVSAFVKTCLWV